MVARTQWPPVVEGSRLEVDEMNDKCVYCESPLAGGNHDKQEYVYACGTKYLPHSTEFSVTCLRAYVDYLETDRDHWYFEYNLLHDAAERFLKRTCHIREEFDKAMEKI